MTHYEQNIHSDHSFVYVKLQHKNNVLPREWTLDSSSYA